MALPRVLVLVLAGGAGSRLELLTERRAKAAVPFAGVYRLIDVPLSNCQHSQLADVWVTTQFHPASLSKHLANGRPWDLDRTFGGLMTLAPYRGDEREGWHEGTADSVWRNSELIREYDADALVVLSADAVYRLDYRAVVDAHLESGAEVTMVTTDVDIDDAGRYGVVTLGEGGRITDYAYKPDEPAGPTVANEVFVMAPDAVLDRLETLGRDVGEEGLQDLGTHLLPAVTQDGGTRAYPLEGYWRDLGTLEAYWQAHADFLTDSPPFDLDDPAWPMHSRGGRHAAARIGPGARVERSMVSGGARVVGTVTGSVLAPGVVVEAGATVTDAVLLPGVRVCAGATVTRAVLDDGVTVGPRATVGADGGDLALVGRQATVDADSSVPPGGRLPEPEQGR
jgi:glucose-1-phosphate adenylyltransferase